MQASGQYEDDISVAPGIRLMKKFKGNVRKKRYSTPKITLLVNLHLLITLQIFT